MVTVTGWVELIFAGVMALGVIGLFLNRHLQEKSLTLRSIQFLSILLVVPAIIILSLEEIISPQSTTALLGALLGYILSGFGERNS